MPARNGRSSGFLDRAKGVRHAAARIVWSLSLLSMGTCGRMDPGPPSIASDMRPVPGARFRMGTDSADLPAIVARLGLGDAGPLMPEVPGHLVNLDDFLVDTVDVTNEAFARFVAANPAWSREEADTSLHNGRYLEHWTPNGPPEALLSHPVTFVTWQAAVAYCAWAGKRLPTEAEYEWAAQDPANPGEYPWGDAEPHDSLVNWSGSETGGTVPVASYPPNGRGLYDMAGNVWKFTADPWLDGMEPAAIPGRIDEVRIRRVVRGGSWGANAANLRVRYRDSHRPFDAREMVGFRCARSAEASR